MKTNKLRSLFFIIISIVALMLAKDMFFTNVLNFKGKVALTKNYQFVKEAKNPQIIYTYYNEYEKKNITIRHTFKYLNVLEKISNQKEIYVKYNSFYSGEPQIIGEPYFVKLLISSFGVLICILVLTISIKELLSFK